MALIRVGKKIKIYTSLLEKYYDAYRLIDDRRRKAFYQYYYIAVILFISFYAASKNEKIGISIIDTLIKLMIELNLVPYIPLLILALLIRYIYFCSHTLRSLVDYLMALRADSFEKEHRPIPLSDLYASFQQRDISTHFNFFLPPRRASTFSQICLKKAKGFTYPRIAWTILIDKLIVMGDVPNIHTFEKRSLITNKNKIEISKKEEII